MKNYYDILDERFQALDSFEKLVVVLGLSKALRLAERFSGKNFYIPKKPTKRLLFLLNSKEQERLIETFGAGERIYINEFSAISRPVVFASVMGEIKGGVKYREIAKRFGISKKQIEKIAKIDRNNENNATKKS